MSDKQPPARLIETWLYLANSDRDELVEAKAQAIWRLKKQFGSVELAHHFVQQSKSKQKEVHAV